MHQINNMAFLTPHQSVCPFKIYNGTRSIERKLHRGGRSLVRWCCCLYVAELANAFLRKEAASHCGAYHGLQVWLQRTTVEARVKTSESFCRGSSSSGPRWPGYCGFSLSLNVAQSTTTDNHSRRSRRRKRESAAILDELCRVFQIEESGKSAKSLAGVFRFSFDRYSAFFRSSCCQ